MEACLKHPGCVVVYDEPITKFECPLCRKNDDSKFKKLEDEYDELETSYSELMMERDDLRRQLKENKR